MRIRIGIVGCGNMGGAIVKGMIAKKITTPNNICIYDKDGAKAETLSKETGCRFEPLADLISGSNFLLLAVKPQNAQELFAAISKGLKKHTLISIMAGLTIAAITKLAEKDLPVARSMPNMAAKLGHSVTAVTFNGLVKDKKTINDILGSIGAVVEVEESQMDAVTAVSGSGPAYFFYLARAMKEAGIRIGLTSEVSEKLVRDTFLGSALVAKDLSAKTLDEMIQMVASKGGTTEAALTVFDNAEHAKVSEHIAMGLVAAEKRAKELSKG
jgi:pyrroline-5-carboxylate reductase